MRTHTPTRKLAFEIVGTCVQLLLVDHPVIAYQVEPSYAHHLYICGPLPPEIDAVYVTERPTGNGSGRDAAMPVKVSGPLLDAAADGAGLVLDDDVDDLTDAEIGNGMLPFAAGLS